MRPLLTLLLLCALPLTAHVRHEGLRTAKQLEQRGGAVCVLVRDLETDSLLVDWRSRQDFCPASLTKIPTTAAFLALRGADYRFRMPLLLDGVQQGETFQGRLIVQASGDPSLGSHYVPERTRLLQQLDGLLRQRGIRHFTGGIQLQLRDLPEPAYGVHWLEEDLDSYYGAPVSGCNIGDNYADLYLSSDSEGAAADYDLASVSLPSSSGLELSSRTSVSSQISPAGDSVYLSGQIRPGLMRRYQRMPLSSPAHYAALWLSEGLQQRGISFGEAPRLDYDRQTAGDTLGVYESLPADTLVRITNFRSANVYAEALAYHLNRPEERPEGLPKGVLRYWTDRLKLDRRSLDLRDGSGLSRSGRLQPQALEQILRCVWQDSTLREPFLYSLPRAGYEGSVRSLTLRPEITAQVKSGSLRGVRGYAGYLEHEGRWYSIVYIANGIGAEAARQGFIQTANELFYPPAPAVSGHKAGAKATSAKAGAKKSRSSSAKATKGKAAKAKPTKAAASKASRKGKGKR